MYVCEVMFCFFTYNGMVMVYKVHFFHEKNLGVCICESI